MPEHSLTIVIPALNEEDAIASTITRCLEARSEIMATAGLSAVEVVVVVVLRDAVFASPRL